MRHRRTMGGYVRTLRPTAALTGVRQSRKRWVDATEASRSSARRLPGSTVRSLVLKTRLITSGIKTQNFDGIMRQTEWQWPSSDTRWSAPRPEPPASARRALGSRGDPHFHRPRRERLDGQPPATRRLHGPPTRRGRPGRLEARPAGTQHSTCSCCCRRIDISWHRVPQSHRRSAHRRADGQSHAHHHGPRISQ
jgi:hypothetical protein